MEVEGGIVASPKLLPRGSTTECVVWTLVPLSILRWSSWDAKQRVEVSLTSTVQLLLNVLGLIEELDVVQSPIEPEPRPSVVPVGIAPNLSDTMSVNSLDS